MQTIWLEFRRATGDLAAMGSDVTFYIDGRWGKQRTEDEIHQRVRELRALRRGLFNKLHFVGYTISGRPGQLHVKMWDEDPPSWVSKILN